jgi:hypothetical protein
MLAGAEVRQIVLVLKEEEEEEEASCCVNCLMI